MQALPIQRVRGTNDVLPPDDASEEQVEHVARGYILHMLASVFFPDNNKTTVPLKWLQYIEDLEVCGRYSWGSAVLAYLYTELTSVALCAKKEITLCAVLFQVGKFNFKE